MFLIWLTVTSFSKVFGAHKPPTLINARPNSSVSKLARQRAARERAAEEAAAQGLLGLSTAAA